MGSSNEDSFKIPSCIAMKRKAWFSLLLMTVLSIIISRGVLFNVLKIILAMRAYFACARGSVGTARQLRLCDAAPACEAGDPANLGSLGSAPPWSDGALSFRFAV